MAKTRKHAARRGAAPRSGAVGGLQDKTHGNVENNAAGAVCGVVFQHSAVSGLLLRVTEDLPGERVRAVVVASGRSSLRVGVAYPFRRAALCEVGR